MKYKILGLIPARKNSKSLPHKNIRLLGGLPLIAFSIRAALKSKYINRVIVSTDSEKIRKAAKKYGAEAPFLRPASLAGDKTSMSAVIKHALRYLEESENYLPDIIVLLQPTSPLRSASDIDKAVKKLISTKADAVVSVCPVKEHPLLMRKLCGGKLASYTKTETPLRRQDFPALFILNGAVYAFWRRVFFKYGNIYGKDTRPLFMERVFSVDIDDTEDFALAEANLNKLKKR